MEMTLPEFMSNLAAGVTTHITDMGVSREGTKTYTIIFHGNAEEIDGFTYYEWIQCTYAVVSQENDLILEMHDNFDSSELEQLYQGMF